MPCSRWASISPAGGAAGERREVVLSPAAAIQECVPILQTYFHFSRVLCWETQVQPEAENGSQLRPMEDTACDDFPVPRGDLSLPHCPACSLVSLYSHGLHPGFRVPTPPAGFAHRQRASKVVSSKV